MKIRPAGLLFFLVSTAFLNYDSIQAAESDPYKLVWADEFDCDGKPSPANWNFEKGFIRNNELQWYQEDNAECKNGKLIIVAKRERKKNPSYVPGSRNPRASREYADYTSASLLTRGLHHWIFGRFEMRAKIDTRPGIWPAFWTMGAYGNWPYTGEIDIMEYYQDELRANIGWGSANKWKPVWRSSVMPIGVFRKADKAWSDKFHVWRMDWDKNSIDLYVDDKLLNTIDLTKTVNQDAEGANPFLRPHYILINLAVGGQMGGDPSQTAFPAHYEIDYVRVYQKLNDTEHREKTANLSAIAN